MTRAKCEGCLIVTGGVEEDRLIDFRGHYICSWCIVQWKKREEREGRKIDWQEFTEPDSKKAKKKK